MAVAHEYDRRGYSLFSCVRPWDAGVVQFVAEALGLGRPFVPSLYTADSATQFYEHAGVNVITTAPDSRAADHPAFGSRDALELHTDATLEAIGRVKSAMLFCMAPAADGGRTTLFRASAAFVEIARRERGLAAALLAEDGLVRHATVGRARRAHVGPVFAFQNGEVLSRYSATARDEWAFDSVPRLKEAFGALEALARPGSGFYTELPLDTGQGILIANDRVAHGRTSFRDRPDVPRRMLRALYLGRPRGRVGPACPESSARRTGRFVQATAGD